SRVVAPQLQAVRVVLAVFGCGVGVCALGAAQLDRNAVALLGRHDVSILSLELRTCPSALCIGHCSSKSLPTQVGPGSRGNRSAPGASSRSQALPSGLLVWLLHLRTTAAMGEWRAWRAVESNQTGTQCTRATRGVGVDRRTIHCNNLPCLFLTSS